MARARNIKPAFFENEELAQCSSWARLCFIGLWCLADREGRLRYLPTRIKMQLFPGDSIEVAPLLDELVQHGFIERYQAGGLDLIQILAFHKHQHPHFKEPPSTFPPPLNGMQASGFSPIEDDDARGSPPLEQASSPRQAQGAPPIARGSNPEIERGVNPADSGSRIPDPGSRIPDSGLRGSTPARASAREAVASKRSREPEWRTAERKRIAAVAPAAVAGDIAAVFEPIDERRKG